MRFLLVVSASLAALASASAAEGAAKAEHPYLLWTRKDLAEIKKKIETEAWAKEAWQQLAADTDKQGADLRQLFRYAVMGDAAAGAEQKRKLLSLLRAPDPLGAALEWRILAYDLLHAELKPEEREALEARFRKYIGYANKPCATWDPALFNNAANYARYDGKNGKYTRTNWLPNIIWPWKTSANLMAAAIGDERLIRETWSTYGSMKWYFDECLADSGFYSEEFSKMTSTPGAMFLYCNAVRNLGLDELGFGYRGKGGATMRGHIESLMRITFPRVDLGSVRPKYPRVSAGDVRPWFPFEAAVVEGYFPNGSGGNTLLHQAGAWGGTTRGQSQQWDGDKTEKLGYPLLFELGHRFWPDAGFDYFLAQMRPPGQDLYRPTLYFGLDPVDPRKVRAPAAQSAVYPDRGIVMLRAEEGPSHWESPAPALCLRLTAEYAHHVNDQLALCGYYAFNRPIYQNPKSDPGYAFKFSRSVRSHCSVMVDGQIKVQDWGQTGSLEPHFTDDCVTRQGFTPEVKFVAARTKKRYEGVDETRALMLTREYLFDVFSCTSAKPHAYVWIIHTMGQAEPEAGRVFAPSQDLADLVRDLKNERSCKVAGQDWSVTVRQGKPDGERPGSPLTEAWWNIETWWNRKIGVRVRMLGEADTTAYLTSTPTPRSGRPDEAEPVPWVDGVTLAASRNAPATAFVALHEPFEGQPRLTAFERIAQTPEALAVRVRGEGVDDRLLLRLGDAHDQPVTLADERESFTFRGWAFVRASGGKVCVRGGLSEMMLQMAEAPKEVWVNGQAAKGVWKGGVLSWSEGK